METPPPNSQARNTSNVHANMRTEGSMASNIEYDDKVHKSSDVYQKMQSKSGTNNVNPLEEREIVQRCLNDMRKQVKYIEETNWMFDTEQIIPMENLVGL